MDLAAKPAGGVVVLATALVMTALVDAVTVAMLLAVPVGAPGRVVETELIGAVKPPPVSKPLLLVEPVCKMVPLLEVTAREVLEAKVTLVKV